MSVQTLDQRLASLLRLRTRVDEEIRRVDAALNERPSPRPRRRNYERPPCGTEHGYQWHRRHGEDKDDACLRAHAEYERDRYLRERLRRAS